MDEQASIEWDDRLATTIKRNWDPAGRRPRTRFAPSPTGFLHLGHVLHMRWLWGVAELLDLEVIVRLENHDRERCTADYERAILDDMEWLGFDPEPASLASLNGPPPSPFRQGDHPERYQAAFDDLLQRGLLYGCTCTRKDLPPPDSNGERRYPGTCRGQPVDRDGGSTVRVMLPDDKVEFSDLLLGRVSQHPVAEHGDPVVRGAGGEWSYQFSVVVDDLHDDIGLIVRGEDLLSSTGRQWLLARSLGRETMPLTLHHPLLLDADGRKLSKRDGSTTIGSLRAAGVSREGMFALT